MLFGSKGRGSVSIVLAVFVLATLLVVSIGTARAVVPGSNGKIAFVSFQRSSFSGNITNSAKDSYVMNADGTGRTQLTQDSQNIDDTDPVWSPDGTKIAFVSFQRSSFSGNISNSAKDIYVMNADGTGRTQLTQDSQNIDDTDPVWSPDGTKIAFVSFQRSSFSGNITSSAKDIYVMNADGSGRTQLTQNTQSIDDTTPAWSPDGTKIAFVSWFVHSATGNISNSAKDIYVMNANGTGRTQLTDDSQNIDDTEPDWQTESPPSSPSPSPTPSASGSPASTTVSSTASVDSGLLISGEQRYVYLNLKNTDSKVIDVVQILLPFGLTLIEGENAEWAYTSVTSGGRFSGSLLPGATERFAMIIQRSPTAGDASAALNVKASANAGANFTASTAVAPGLTLSSRVLEVESVEVIGPPGTTDGTATSGQRIDVRGRIRNHGSTNVLVTASIEAPDDTVISNAPSQTISAGQSRDFTFELRLGPPGDREFRIDGSATGIDGIEEYGDRLEVEPRAQAQQASASMSPSTSTGRQASSYQLALEKTTGPAVSLSPSSVLTFARAAGGSFTAHLDEAVQLDAGQDLTALSFTPDSSAPLLDGIYTGSLRLLGTDANDEGFDELLSVDVLTVDSSIPTLDATLLGPPGQIDGTGMTTVKPGDVLTLRGAAYTDSTEQILEPTAEIVECRVVYLDWSGLVEVGAANLPLPSCFVAAGVVAGSFTVETIPSGTEFARVDLRIRRLGSLANPPRQVTDPIRVDTQAPGLLKATKVCEGDSCLPSSTVRVLLTEKVRGSFSTDHFSVTGTSVESISSACSSESFCDEVILNVSDTIGFGDQPSVSYSPANSLTDARDAAMRALVAGAVGVQGIEFSLAREAQEDCNSQGLTLDLRPSNSWSCTHAHSQEEFASAGGDGDFGASTVPPAACDGDGDSREGKRTRVLYAHFAKTSSHDRSTAVPIIRKAIARSDYWLNRSSPYDHHFRWWCRNDTRVSIGSALLRSGHDDDSSVESRFDVVRSLQDPPNNKNNEDLLYLVFVDDREIDANGACNTGGGDFGTAAAESPSVDNPNNTEGPEFSLVCYQPTYANTGMAHAALHESFHSLGAVQYAAPHSSGHPGSEGYNVHHCFEEWDLMCYKDDGDYYDGPDGIRGDPNNPNDPHLADDREVEIRSDCVKNWFVDCHYDDYFNPSGSVMSSDGSRAIWNVADSVFLVRN